MSGPGGFSRAMKSNGKYDSTRGAGIGRNDSTVATAADGSDFSSFLGPRESSSPWWPYATRTQSRPCLTLRFFFLQTLIFSASLFGQAESVGVVQQGDLGYAVSSSEPFNSSVHWTQLTFKTVIRLLHNSDKYADEVQFLNHVLDFCKYF